MFHTIVVGVDGREGGRCAGRRYSERATDIEVIGVGCDASPEAGAAATLERPCWSTMTRRSISTPGRSPSRHVAEALPAARHLELDCGHVPQGRAAA